MTDWLDCLGKVIQRCIYIYIYMDCMYTTRQDNVCTVPAVLERLQPRRSGIYGYIFVVTVLDTGHARAATTMEPAKMGRLTQTGSGIYPYSRSSLVAIHHPQER